MTHLLLIRGLPGSGKSTLALTLRGYRDWETDLFFQNGNDYKFDAAFLTTAHVWCQHHVKSELEKGLSVVVSNTFTRIWEMQPYIDMGHPTSVISLINRPLHQNVHGVPEEVVNKMRARWEPYAGELVL